MTVGRKVLAKEKKLRSFTLTKDVIEMLEKLRTENYYYNSLSDIVNIAIEKEYNTVFDILEEKE